MPSTPADIESDYAHRHQTLTAQFAATVRHSTVVRLALFSAVAALVYTVVAAGRGRYPLRLSLLPLAAAVALLLWLLRLYTTQDRLARLSALYERALARVRHTPLPPGATPIPTGEDLRPAHHLFDRDLSILGPDSLFSALCTVRTGLGQRGLANLLLHPSHSVAEIRARQIAVQELTPNFTLREHIALLGVTNAQQLPATHFDLWFADPHTPFPRYAPPLLALLSTLLLAGLIAGAAHWLPWSTVVPNLLLLAIFQSAICLLLRRRVLPILAQAKRLAPQLLMLRDGILLLQRYPAESSHLRDLQSQIPPAAPAHLRRLHNLFSIAEQRTKEYFFVFSLLTAAGTQTAIAAERWRQQHGPAMQEWIAAWSHFEALNALATFTHEHPQYPFPTLLAVAQPQISPSDSVILSGGAAESTDLRFAPAQPAGPSTNPVVPTETAGVAERPASPTINHATFDATDLAHPLLPTAIPNTITLNAETRFLVISGSNMAGKSTLLRAIGVNTVLALAGAPVRATAFTLTPLALGASIALADSLAEGRSKFRAEVERLRDLVALTHNPEGIPVLFLVDEILSGTNSVDRQQASDSILRSLLGNRAIGALSTHDLALTAIAEDLQLHGENTHMASPDPADPLAFDYLLKPGPNRSSSAQAILRLLGL